MTASSPIQLVTRCPNQLIRCIEPSKPRGYPMDDAAKPSRCMLWGNSGTLVSGSTTAAPGKRFSSRYLMRSVTSKNEPNAE